MRHPKATLTTEMVYEWHDDAWHDAGEAEVEITYTFDGNDWEITLITGGNDVPDHCWNDLEDYAADRVGEVCDAAYAEWLEGYGDYLFEQQRDREPAE